MRARFAILTVLVLFSALIASPAHLHGLQADPAQQADPHHPGTPEPDRVAPPEPQTNMMMMAAMMASDAKLDALVKTMNVAKGAAKTDAIAELLTALVQDHQTMRRSMMSNNSMMSNMMGTSGRGDSAAMMPKK
jgi:hypothetical protein